jgi:hypothetical protein
MTATSPPGYPKTSGTADGRVIDGGRTLYGDKTEQIGTNHKSLQVPNLPLPHGWGSR